MDAENYLKQEGLLCIKVQQLRQEYEQLQKEEQGGEIGEKTKERLTKQVQEYIVLQDEIISNIHKLYNPLHIKILHRKYIDFKKLKEIAKELGYEYGYIRQQHRKGLEALDKILTPNNNES